MIQLLLKEHVITRSLVKHDSSEKHQKCIDAKKILEAPEKAPLPSAVIKLTRQQNDYITKLFRTVYCIVKQNMSLRSYPALIQLQCLNGLQVGKAYRNRTAATNFIRSISTVIYKTIIDDLNSQEYFSVLIDGSTDVAIKEQEIIYVKFIKDGKPTIHFLGLI